MAGMKIHINRRKFIIRGCQALAGITLLDALWFEKLFFEANEFTLGESNVMIKVVQLSDLHLHSITSVHRKIASRVNQAKPHLILFTGDSVDKAEYTDLLRNFLQLLDPAVQKVAIPGNWEYWGNIDMQKLRLIYSDFNCDLLINQSKQYTFQDKKIAVTGIDDFVGGNADYTAARKYYKTSNYHIILTHCPQHRDILINQRAGERIDLILSGHTHGGQLNIAGFAPFKPPGSGKYLHGWYTDAKPPLYVSKGIGTSILPIRFGARSEISIFNIHI